MAFHTEVEALEYLCCEMYKKFFLDYRDLTRFCEVWGGK